MPLYLSLLSCFHPMTPESTSPSTPHSQTQTNINTTTNQLLEQKQHQQEEEYVTVLYFSIAKNNVTNGLSQESWPISTTTQPTTLSSLIHQQILTKYPKFKQMYNSMMISHNLEYIDKGNGEMERIVLKGGDEIAFIPPVSGG